MLLILLLLNSMIVTTGKLAKFRFLRQSKNAAAKLNLPDTP